MRLRDNLFLQFVVVSVLSFVVLGLVVSFFSSRRVNALLLDEIVRDAQDVAVYRLMGGVQESDFAAPMDAARYTAFDSFVRQYVLSSSTARVKLWSKDGMVTYSDAPSLVGQTFPIESELAEALRGGTATEVSVPQSAENERERDLGTLVEVYVPVVLPGSSDIIGAFEVYQFYAPIARIINDIRGFEILWMALSFLALFLILGGFIWWSWFQTRRSQTLLNSKVRDLQGLNNMFQTYLNQEQDMANSLKVLRRQAEAAPATDEAQRSLVRDIIKLDEDMSKAMAYARLAGLGGRD